MGILSRRVKEGEMNVSQKCQTIGDCSSEDFNKPKLSSSIANKMILALGSNNKLQQKQNFTMNVIIDLATQLERITIKINGISLSSFVYYDLSLEDCTCFISKWSKELKSFKTNKGYNAASCRSYSESLKRSKVYIDQTLTEDQKYLVWWILILQSLPESSVCQEESELINLYSQWKNGRLKNILPIMDFIMRTLLNEKGIILNQL